MNSHDIRAGWAYGFIGVLIFSLTLPATRIAVAEIDPLLVTALRAVFAAVCAAVYLVLTRAPFPSRSEWRSLVVVAIGVVLGFPLMSSIAMRSVAASHGAIVNGLIPLATALCALRFAHERPTVGYWICALLGSALVVAFSLGNAAGSIESGDWAMMGAVVLAGVGYAEGGVLSRTMGGARVISWALVVALPLMLPLCLYGIVMHPAELGHASPRALGGLLYVSVFSMFVGFLFWYRGLARGGVANVSQIQLLQPFLTVCSAALLTNDPLSPRTLFFALAVIVTLYAGRHFSTRRTATLAPSPLLPR